MSWLPPLGEIRCDAQSPPQHLQMCADQLLYQAKALGLQHTASDPDGAGGWSYQLNLPDGVSVHNRISAWADADDASVGEIEMQARTGILSVHGRARRETRPLGLPYVSTLTASLSMQAALAVSVAQVRGARLAQTHTSLAGAALVSMCQYLSECMENPASSQSVQPEAQPPFTTVDGVQFELETLNPDHWRGFWCELGFSGTPVAQGWIGFMQRYARAYVVLPVELVSALQNLTWRQVVETAGRTGVAVCPVTSLRAHALDSAHSVDGDAGIWTFSGRPALRCDPTKSSSGATLPLSGVRVLESCRRIQGPLAGRLLQWLGAEVIRLEPPGGDSLRAMPPLLNDCSIRFQALNGEKQVIEVDIKSARGRERIRELVRESDVFLHNWAPEKAQQLHLEAADLHSVNPHLVYFHAGGWHEGKEPDLPGTDFTVQAYSGVAAEIARRGGGRGGSLFTLLDILGGAAAAQGVCAGLLHSHYTPVSLRGYSSLLGAAHLLTRLEPAADLSSVPEKVVEALPTVINDPQLAPYLATERFCQVTSPWRFA